MSSADFWSGYVSGAIGILVGNPLDLIKTRLQAGTVTASAAQTTQPRSPTTFPWTKQFSTWSALTRGAAAPILGYGALNALLFVTYNRSLALLSTGSINHWPERPSAASIWTAGALGGLAIWLISAPTELVKCRAQVSDPPRSSWEVTKDLWKAGGVRALYLGGGVTSVRDSVGYGFYFWSYHLSKQAIVREKDSSNETALKVLLCGGLAGVVTWASIFPLDVVKTRVQTWDYISLTKAERQPLLAEPLPADTKALHKGVSVFFRGLGICSARAFFVNAVQWAIYEGMMSLLVP